MPQRFADYVFEQFEWPESLVVDLLSDHYGTATMASEALVLAKIHQHVLRDLYDGEIDRARAWRGELDKYGEGAGLEPECVAKADRLVFWELLTLVQRRYRTSARSRVTAAERLREALGLLNAEPVPAKVARTWARSVVRPLVAEAAPA